MHVGTHLAFEQTDTQAEVLEYLSEGVRILKFSGDVRALMESQGQLPVPPYIDSPLSPDQIKEKYQTVYASREGAVAAPTAGFHFTPELIKKLKEQGVQTAELTLHVGLGTFRPVQASDIREHPMHAERFELSQEVIDAIDRTKKQGGRVIAVGTTVTRVLEGLHKRDGKLNVGSGEINVFIYPGFEFKVIDGLITNFHLPESTLLMLVSALMGREKILEIYHQAIAQKYRFFSFGDGMLLI
jgi:S-adenosylmethionine:tRNA ribosyltransferase-isomerase